MDPLHRLVPLAPSDTTKPDSPVDPVDAVVIRQSQMGQLDPGFNRVNWDTLFNWDNWDHRSTGPLPRHSNIHTSFCLTGRNCFARPTEILAASISYITLDGGWHAVLVCWRRANARCLVPVQNFQPFGVWARTAWSAVGRAPGVRPGRPLRRHVAPGVASQLRCGHLDAAPDILHRACRSNHISLGT